MRRRFTMVCTLTVTYPERCLRWATPNFRGRRSIGALALGCVYHQRLGISDGPPCDVLFCRIGAHTEKPSSHRRAWVGDDRLRQRQRRRLLAYHAATRRQVAVIPALPPPVSRGNAPATFSGWPRWHECRFPGMAVANRCCVGAPDGEALAAACCGRCNRTRALC